MMKIVCLLCSFYLCVILVDGQDLYEGDPCTTQTAQSGTCTKVSECIPVQNALQQGKTNHVVCGFDGFMQIVCCPNAERPTTTSPPPSSSRKTLTSDRVSVRKCNEYKELPYNKILVYTSFGSIERKVLNCSFKALPLILGGTEAKIGEFPHMALIGSENDRNTIHWACGGTLISEQFVLTAAHCFYSREYGSPKYVRLGEHDQNHPGDGTEIELRIIECIQHPQYKYAIKYNDIGLLKLERRIDLTGSIRPACLPEQSSDHTERAIASGWGTVQNRNSVENPVPFYDFVVPIYDPKQDYENVYGGEGSNVLLKVILEMFTQTECNTSLSHMINRNLKSGILEDTQVCAGSHTERRDTCPGDSGGPLQIYHATHNCTYTIVGVTSFGSFCGTIGKPGVYTRVYAYLDWIEQIVWPDE